MTEPEVTGVPALKLASAALAERRFEDAVRFAERALAGALDLDAYPSERGEHVDLPERALALHCLGTAQLELGQRAAALAAFDESLHLHPNPHYTWSNRAVARRDTGDLEGALSDFGEAIVRFRGYPHARYNRALLLAQLGRLDEAEVDHLWILRGNPTSQPSIDAWTALRRTRGLPHDEATRWSLTAELR